MKLYILRRMLVVLSPDRHAEAEGTKHPAGSKTNLTMRFIAASHLQGTDRHSIQRY